MIDFVFLDETHCGKTGAYRIWFGSKYYIGATVDTQDRVRGHYRTLVMAFLYGDRLGKNSISKIVNHLLCNPGIKTAFVELLEECKTELQLVDAEHRWLHPCKDDENCLNYQFKVHRTIGNVIYRPNGNNTVKTTHY